jgi:hypothetical protein
MSTSLVRATAIPVTLTAFIMAFLVYYNEWHVRQGTALLAASHDTTNVVSTAFINDDERQNNISMLVEDQKIRLPSREDRFPSAEERVRLYMSNWYLPPCHHGAKTSVGIRYRYDSQRRSGGNGETLNVTNMETPDFSFILNNTVKRDTMFYLDRETVRHCAAAREERPLLRSYCQDTVNSVMPAMNRVTTSNDDDDVPIILQFGDYQRCKAHDTDSVNVPRIKKFRLAMSREELQRVTSSDELGDCIGEPRPVPHTTSASDARSLQPIIWKLNVERHYDKVREVAINDVGWSRKKNVAVFRGARTGAIPYNESLSVTENCMMIQRCRLVYRYHNSTLIDAALTGPDRRFPPVLNGVPLMTGEKLTLEQMLRYKAIICLEGNDVSSGLKWALSSRSVVIMPSPVAFTSWAMEELLEPWVHYVPCRSDLSDIEDSVQWVLDHPEEAREIAIRGTLWIHDLVYHKDAAQEEEWIFDEILRRYRAQFITG